MKLLQPLNIIRTLDRLDAASVAFRAIVLRMGIEDTVVVEKKRDREIVFELSRCLIAMLNALPLMASVQFMSGKGKPVRPGDLYRHVPKPFE